MELPNRSTLEADFARRLSTLSSKHRRELTSYLGSPPDPTRVPPEFWARVEREFEEELAAFLLLILIASADFHGASESVAREIGERESVGRAREVADGYRRVGEERLREAGRRWGQQEKPPTKAQVADDLTTIFGPSRDSSIAVTETTNAQSIGGERAIALTAGLNPDDLWITEEDANVCPICRPLHLTKREVWSRYFPNGPAAHPVCRCHIRYAGIQAAGGTT